MKPVFLKFLLVIQFIFLISLNTFGSAKPDKDYENDVVKYLYEAAGRHFRSSKIVLFGQSEQGTPIYGLKIGTGDVSQLVLSGFDPNDTEGPDVAVHLAQTLASDSIRGKTVYILPTLYPDRFSTDEEEFSDVNKDFVTYCDDSKSKLLHENQILVDFINSNKISTVILIKNGDDHNISFPSFITEQADQSFEKESQLYLDIYEKSYKRMGFKINKLKKKKDKSQQGLIDMSFNSGILSYAVHFQELEGHDDLVGTQVQNLRLILELSPERETQKIKGGSCE